MAFGSEVLLLLGGGFVVLGPKRMQSMIGQIGRAKAQFAKASRSFMSEVESGLDEQPETPGDGEICEHDELVLPDELIEKIANRHCA
jgi:Sec-independent protein translocase protein TatA